MVYLVACFEDFLISRKTNDVAKERKIDDIVPYRRAHSVALT
jgi:hypothetical protein